MSTEITTAKIKLMAAISRISESPFKETLQKQRQKGLEKYGHSIEDCPDNYADWQDMMLEELVDAYQYLIKGKKDKILSEDVEELEAFFDNYYKQQIFNS